MGNNNFAIGDSSKETSLTGSEGTQKPNISRKHQYFTGDIIIGNPHRINVDDNFHVLNLSGHSLRIQWSFVVMNYCNKDVKKAKEMYKKLFINHDEFMFPTHGGQNTLYRQAFDREFGIIVTKRKVVIHSPQKSRNGIEVKEGQWLFDYEETIIQTIEQHKHIQVIAPTGTGKTYFMNHLASKRKCIIVMPFNSQIYLYRKIPQQQQQTEHPFIFGKSDPPPTPEEVESNRIAQSDYNYVCIRQNNVIDNSECVVYNDSVRKPFVSLTRTGDENDTPTTTEVEYMISADKLQFDPERTNICVWDQFVKRMHGLNTDFTEHIIIVDESHLLFCDRCYRKSAVMFIEFLKKFVGKVVLMTATPTWEHKLLPIDKTLIFQRERKPIKLNWIDSTNPYNSIARLIDVLRNSKAKIVVFSDVNSRKLYENCLAKGKHKEGEITMFHSKFLNQPNNNATEIIKKEFLDRELTICTRLAYAGLNFKNENEKIIVVIEVTKKTDYAYVLQALGRIRNADVEGYVVFDLRPIDIPPVACRKNAAEEFKRHQDNPIISNFLLDKEKYTNWGVEMQLEKYYSAESNKSMIIKKLCQSGYVEVRDYGGDRFPKGKVTNEYKRKESDLFIETVINQYYHEPLNFEQASLGYRQEWLVRYYNILSGMRQQDVRKYINLRKRYSTVAIDTIFGELEDLVTLCKMTKRIRKRLLNNHLKYAETITHGWRTPWAIYQVEKKCKELNRILKKVIVFKGINDIDVTIEELLSAKMNIIEEEKARIKVIRSENGKKGDKQKKSEGGKKGDKAGKREGGRKGGKKSSRSQAITLEWIGDEKQRPDGLDEMGRIRFESKTLCRIFLGVGSECFNRFCKEDTAATKLRKKWKIVKIEK